MKTVALVSVLAILMLMVSSAPARVLKPQSLSREKRQSDQRLAELETLLALQKYGRHRFRTDRKKGVGADGEHPPGYGIIDFRMLGRKKKSTRFSPGELAIDSSRETFQPPTSFQQRESSWASSSDEDRSFYPDSAPLLDQDEKRQEAAPLLYIEKK